MAVVQISRIQIRRGQKNQGSGLPQLASGELGWAVDTQELFIGNGAVSEGAPYVGNTKILSEHDDLFEFAQNYSYRSDTAAIITGPNDTDIQRTLQERLDDIVSVRSFGADGDGNDHTQAFQRAIDQLYLNTATVSNPQSRVILNVEPGNYTISSTLYIPPFVTLKGAGIDKTIFNFTGTGPLFQTSRGTAIDNVFTPDDYGDESATTTLVQARNIHLSGFTANIASGQKGLVLENCRDSEFENIKLVGTRDLGDVADFDELGISFNSLSSVVTCKNNIFSNIIVESFFRAVYSDNDILENTFDNCRFYNLYGGFVFGENTDGSSPGQLTGPSKNIIKNCLFYDVEKQGIYIEKGISNISSNNKFYSVGNDGASNATPITAIVEFQDEGNISDADWFERAEDLGNGNALLDTTEYIPEVITEGVYENQFSYKLTPFASPSTFEKFFKLPAERSRSFEIDYIYKSTTAIRNGIMKITVDPVNDLITFSDDYDVSAADALAKEAHAIDLIFDAQGFSLTSTPTNPIDTVAIMMYNRTGDTGATFYYRVKTIA